MIVLINNRRTTPEKALVSVFSPGLTHGRGIFETTRTYPGKRLFQLDAHLRRLAGSAAKIGLDLLYSSDEIKDMVFKIVEESGPEPRRLKILLIPENLIITSSPLLVDDEIYKGVGLKSATVKRSLPEIKSVAYLDCLLAYERARRAGRFEALLIDKHQYVYEGSRSNIFWIDDGVLCSREKDVLLGVTRGFILENSPLETRFQNIKLRELTNKEAVLITNSVAGIVPATEIDGARINRGQISPTARRLTEWFRSALP